jgi:hypothetical protein
MASPAPIARAFTFEGREWQMIFNWGVIAEFEETTGISIIDAVAPPGGGRPMLSRLAKLLMFGLRPAHPDVTIEDAGRMMADARVQGLFNDQVAAAMPKASDTGEDGEPASGNPPKPRGPRSGGKTG